MHDLVLVMGLLLSAPYWIYLMLVEGKYREGLKQRFGWLPQRSRTGAAPRPACIWIHGVSVGEVLAARRLITRIEAEFPEHEVVISTTTTTGQRVALKEYPSHYVFYYPIDFSPVLRRVLTHLRPAALVLLELEVWPSMLRLAEKREMPVVVVNGRLSPRSYRFYSRFGRFRLGFLNRVHHYGVQVEEFAARMRRLGICSEKVEVTGSLKYDTVQETRRLDEQGLAALEARLHLSHGQPLVVLGSTHPGEAGLLAPLIANLRQRHPDLAVLWVPRHPERSQVVLESLTSAGLPALCLSDMDASGAPPVPGAVIVGDTMGELASFYSRATVVFVGKSLGRERGGQNMLEPAALGCAVAVGPHTANFRTEVDYLRRRGGLTVVEDADELEAVLDEWLQCPEVARAMGIAGRQAVHALSGGGEKSLAIISAALASRPMRSLDRGSSAC